MEKTLIGSQGTYNKAIESLKRVQEFDASSLTRATELGSEMSFLDAVEPARQLIDLFKRLSTAALIDFPDKNLQLVIQHSDAVFQIFRSILSFSLSQGNPSGSRANLITQIESSFSQVFEALHPLISYSLHRSADFQRLDTEARSTFQRIEDESEKITNNLERYEEEAKNVLAEIRKVAAEEGVTKQAVHFKTEFEHHKNEYEKWGKKTFWWVVGILFYAIGSIFFHKIPWIHPESTYDTIQLVVSKILIFSALIFMLTLSAKNFLSHKHNSIVNKHRQNALMTYTALVESAGDEGVRDAVLLQAANCIFSPRSTGYTQGGGVDVSNQKSAIEILSKQALAASK